MLEIKNKKQKTTVTKMKNAIAGLISKLEITEKKRMFELKGLEIESWKTKKQKEQRLKEKNIQGLWDDSKCVTYA